MQLMPGTAAELGVADSFRADQNINGGTAYLDALLVRYHDHLALALAAYNAGPAAVDKYHGVPPYRETRTYVARVIREFNRRKQLERLHPEARRIDHRSAAALSPMPASQ
jgi:soluble lytic murein transglycosylase-like protein